MANGTMYGEDTTCRETGRNCLEFYYEFHNGQKAYSRRKQYLHQHIAPKYGEYVHMTGTMTFAEDELSASNHYFKFLITGPGQYFCFVVFKLYSYHMQSNLVSKKFANEQKVASISP